jgi:hypothetical protein
MLALWPSLTGSERKGTSEVMKGQGMFPIFEVKEKLSLAIFIRQEVGRWLSVNHPNLISKA